MKTYGKMMYRCMGTLCIAAFVCTLAAGCKRDLRVYETVTGDDGSIWEQVSKPGFGNKNNGSIVSMAEFQDSLYAVTRNDMSGFELWRTSFGRWEKMRIPGFTDSVFHDLMINVWSDLIVFQDKLYVAVSSGYQGSKLYKSAGFEIWRFDGRRWEAVVSPAAATTLAVKALKPNLAPIGKSRPRAEQQVLQVARVADDAIENYAWIL